MSIGVDRTASAQVDQSISDFGARYLNRVYTIAETAEAARRGGPGSPQGVAFLTGRFAAKEAVLKALRFPRSRPLSWLDIEVCSAREGWPEVFLHNGAAGWAYAQGIEDVEVSISHDETGATAVATATKRRSPMTAPTKSREGDSET